MGLADIMTSMQDNLPGVTLLFGEESLAINTSPPRVVIVPSGDQFGPARATTTSRGPFQRVFKTRRIGVRMHIWAAELDLTNVDPFRHLKACEALVALVVAAIHKSSAGSYGLGAGEWPASNQSDFGRLCIVAAWFEIPVAFTPDDSNEMPATFTVYGNAQVTSTLDDGTSSPPSGSPAP